jgi:hypothetical protein
MNSIDDNTTSWDYPKELLSEGYPTPEALDYIRNWSMLHGYKKEATKIGQFFGKSMYKELIEYVKSIWTYDTINYEDGLLEIHTVGWSGNEDIIEELKNTDLWLMKFRCEQTGGHYFFKLEDKGYTWKVTKLQID